MNDNDELNDRAVLSAVRDSISGLPGACMAPRLQGHLRPMAALHRRRRPGLGCP